MKRMGAMAAVLAGMLVGGQALADDARLDVLEQRINELSANSGGGMEKFHVGGYGELHYANAEDGDDELDQHRMVVGVGYDYSDSVTFDMEIDYEHAATELELEFAQINFLISDALSARAGVVLLPVGALNDTHEPTLFYSVERPYVQKYVIPTTWNGGGAGIFGRLSGGVSYGLYLVGGLDAHGFTGDGGIRDGRVVVGEAIANDLALVGRVSATPVKGLTLGASGYQGDSGQDTHDFDGNAAVSILEADAALRVKALEIKSTVASVNIDDTGALNAHFANEAMMEGLSSSEVVGEEIFGWNLEGALHLYTGAPKRFLHDVVAFARYEAFNTQESMAAGYSADPANDREVVTGGVAYFPVSEVAIKLDVESWSNQADEDWTVVNAGLAFVY